MGIEDNWPGQPRKTEQIPTSTKWDRLDATPIAPGAKLKARFVTNAYGVKFITVTGPCGEGHTMNFEEALQLRDWLNALKFLGPVILDKKPIDTNNPGVWKNA